MRAACRTEPLIPAHRRSGRAQRGAWARSCLLCQFLLPLHTAGNGRDNFSPLTPGERDCMLSWGQGEDSMSGKGQGRKKGSVGEAVLWENPKDSFIQLAPIDLLKSLSFVRVYGVQSVQSIKETITRCLSSSMCAAWREKC